jgi:hypothetical protein
VVLVFSTVLFSLPVVGGDPMDEKYVFADDEFKALIVIFFFFRINTLVLLHLVSLINFLFGFWGISKIQFFLNIENRKKNINNHT